jgi:hypothetical protein
MKPSECWELGKQFPPKNLGENDVVGQLLSSEGCANDSMGFRLEMRNFNGF